MILLKVTLQKVISRRGLKGNHMEMFIIHYAVSAIVSLVVSMSKSILNLQKTIKISFIKTLV